MREAIGGSWLLGFALTFIVLFSAFLAYSINYTNAFKTKNKIINIIEQNEGFTTYTGSNIAGATEDELSKTTEGKIYNYLNTKSGIKDLDSSVCSSDLGYEETDYHKGGYCVHKVQTRNGAYYKVTTFIKIEIPLIWQTFTIPVSGETTTMYWTSD